MKLKYYLRGLGLGIILTGLILVIARNLNGGMSDKEIIKRAEALGMVMSTEDSLFDKPEGETTASEGGATTESVTDELSSEEVTTGEMETQSSTQETETPSSTEKSESQSSTGEKETASIDESEATLAPEEETTEQGTSEETTEDVTEKATEKATEETTEETTAVKTAVIKITKGMRCMEVADILYKEGIINDAEAFNQYMRQHKYTQEILIGTYTLNSSMSFDEIADKIVRKF